MRILKRLLYSVLIVIILCFILLVTPRVWSALNPGKPPVGYHFLLPGYLAVGIGLEKLIDNNPPVPAEIEEIKDIEYKNINGKSLQLDIYRPRNIVKPAPLLVFIHGGSWSHGKRSDYMVYLMAFAKKGYMTATVSYRLIKDGFYPACAEDISDAVQWLFKNGESYGYDPDRIALIGGSAGAHLALLGAYEWRKPALDADTVPGSPAPHRIKAVVDIYGPIDLTTSYARTQRLVTRFLHHPYSERPDLYVEASPIQYLDKSDPPTMILHGTSDDLVPYSQSDLLKAKLDSLGIPNVYYKVPFWPHAMDVVQRVNDFSQVAMYDFFEKYVR
jgi:acetyl esterase/lipase